MSPVVATDMLAVTDVDRTFGSGHTATRTEPAVGVSSPARMFIRVDLPLPDAPTSATISPSATRRSSPCSACTSIPAAM